MPGLITDAEKLAIQSLLRWMVGKPQEKELCQNVDLAGQFASHKINHFLMYHELLPFVYPFMRRCGVEVAQEQKDFLEAQYYRTLYANASIWQEFQRIADAYNDRGIEYVPLKGIAFLANDLYGSLSLLRPMCDIDILVRQEMLSQAEKCLVALGYTQELHHLRDAYWRTHGYHVEYIRRQPNGSSYVIELHWNLDYPRFAPAFPDLWQRCQRIRRQHREFTLLSPEDYFFSIILHQRRFGKVLCFKYACDAALLVNTPSFDWDYVFRKSRKMGLRAATYFLLVQVNLLLSDGDILPLDLLGLARHKRRRIDAFIMNNLFALPEEKQQEKSCGAHLFLESFFLLHDSIVEPIRQILLLPQEQFAKFYDWEPYSLRTAVFYRCRVFYFGYTLMILVIRRLFKSCSFMIELLWRNGGNKY